MTTEQAPPRAVPRNEVALAELFARLSREMGALETESLRVESVLAGFLDGQRPDGDRAAQESASIQTLDRLVQTLSELRCFLDHLAGTAPAISLDLHNATSGIRLGRLSDMLAGRETDVPAADGAVDFF
ncbi:hypothetical protein SAMN05421853_109115 [Roseivivax halotolerans]|uniref:Uncharacterized protein n=2 Tax=Roseivivax halotolerans TaxID=93684 RepID=A0A1I5ZET2_9RHOB|nr:hypothetical protein SAMN05421853_109115 [Roseivivax halotolerans]